MSKENSSNDSAKKSSERAQQPSDVDGHVSIFDKFATHANEFVSRAWFFMLCVLLVVLWAPSIFFLPSIDTWQLVINTATTIVTFLLVALLQNTQKRSEDAIQTKLNAIAEAVSDILGELSSDEDTENASDRDEAKEAVGLEDKESSG